MHQELNAHGLPCIRRHVQRRIEPDLRVITLMEDRLENRAASIGDISILPVIRNAVGGALEAPEAAGGLR
jgi:hypothetical protein